ncbi:MAG: caspase family protein, partial [Nitrosopumilus sp.]|nr:caspase family protein [Nitrosopumilus sp.]
MSANKGKKKALIIAVSEYDHYDSLEFCKNDGQSMYDTLSKLGYEIPPERKIIGQVSKYEFAAAIIDFFRGEHVNPDDTLLFYYSGHGSPYGEHDYYFVTSETELDKPDVKGFDYDELTKLSRNSKSDKIVKVVDCCYSGALGTSEKSNDNAQAILGREAIEDKFAKEGKGNYVIASSLSTQKSFPRKDRECSEFTFHVINGLNGSDKDSVDKDGFVTSHSLGNYIWKKMKDFEKNQQPINNAQATGDIFLAHYPEHATIQPTLRVGQHSDEDIKKIKRRSNVTLITIAAIVSIAILVGLTYSPPDLQAYSFVAKWGSESTDDGQFDNPSDIAVDSSGNVYVADIENNRIQKFDSNGVFITKWDSKGTGDGQFSAPSGIAVDSSGNVYVADSRNNRIQKFDSNGVFITKWGNVGTDDGQFDKPSGIAVDSSGNVYVNDLWDNRIQKFDSNGVFITKWG